jgi:hypothetical protein
MVRYNVVKVVLLQRFPAKHFHFRLLIGWVLLVFFVESWYLKYCERK